MVEYAIIAAIVAAVALGAVQILGQSVTRAFQRAETSIDGATGTTQPPAQQP
jgi:Flp pilus assembly pilin Flp